MAISRPVRIPEEFHDKAEELAIKATAKRKAIVSKNEILKEATRLGLIELERNIKNESTTARK